MYEIELIWNSLINDININIGSIHKDIGISKEDSLVMFCIDEQR